MMILTMVMKASEVESMLHMELETITGLNSRNSESLTRTL